MKRINFSRSIRIIKVLAVFGVIWWLMAAAPTVGAQDPLGHHCGSTPLDAPPNYCGCQWGAVYYGGQPVSGAVLTLTHTAATITTTTAITIWKPFVYYEFDIKEIAQRWDVLTITATYANMTASRTVRAMPGVSNLQRIDFAFPPSWTTYAAEGDILALELYGDMLWAGTPAGAQQWYLPDGYLTATVSAGFTPPPEVRAFAVDGRGHLWAGTSAGVSEYDGQSWVTHTTGLTSTYIRALAVNPVNGAVCVGAAGQASGGVSCYDGDTWRVLPDFNGAASNSVHALAIDGQGALWIGTYGAGVSKCVDTACTTYTSANGLAADEVAAIAVENDNTLWFATHSSVDFYGEQGGVSRYDVSADTWTTYTVTHGLPSMEMTAIAIDRLGRKWFGAALDMSGRTGGVSVCDDGVGTQRVAPLQVCQTYTTAHGLNSTDVQAVALEGDGTVWVGTTAGINRLHIPALAESTIVSIDAIIPAPAIQGRDIISFTATTQRAGVGIIGYEWWSDLDGPLSTMEDFSLEAEALTVGTHYITFRAQDEEGVWSEAATASLTVQAGMDTPAVGMLGAGVLGGLFAALMAIWRGRLLACLACE